MRKLLVTGVLLAAVAAVALGSLPARAANDCVVVRATADARNQTVYHREIEAAATALYRTQVE